jgi:hypothetical protein
MQSAKLARELPDAILCVDHHYSFCVVLQFEDLYHILSWPQLSYVARDHKGRIVGYILAKMSVALIYVYVIKVNAEAIDRLQGRGRGSASTWPCNLHLCATRIPTLGHCKASNGSRSYVAQALPVDRDTNALLQSKPCQKSTRLNMSHSMFVSRTVPL